jgi:hypothetical protein
VQAAPLVHLPATFGVNQSAWPPPTPRLRRGGLVVPPAPAKRAHPPRRGGGRQRGATRRVHNRKNRVAILSFRFLAFSLQHLSPHPPAPKRRGTGASRAARSLTSDSLL